MEVRKIDLLITIEKNNKAFGSTIDKSTNKVD